MLKVNSDRLTVSMKIESSQSQTMIRSKHYMQSFSWAFSFSKHYWHTTPWNPSAFQSQSQPVCAVVWLWMPFQSAQTRCLGKFPEHPARFSNFWTKHPFGQSCPIGVTFLPGEMCRTIFQHQTLLPVYIRSATSKPLVRGFIGAKLARLLQGASNRFSVAM